jgi:hypothetical protein
MPTPFFVAPDGVPMVTKKNAPTPLDEIEEPSLAQIAQKEAARVSTKRFTNKVDDDV